MLMYFYSKNTLSLMILDVFLCFLIDIIHHSTYILSIIIGTFSYETTKKGKKMETATISGGMLEASRMIEYLYQMTFSWYRDYCVPNKLITYTYNDGNGHIIKMQYNPMQLFFDASNCTMALNHLLSRKRFTE